MRELNHPGFDSAPSSPLLATSLGISELEPSSYISAALPKLELETRPPWRIHTPPKYVEWFPPLGRKTSNTADGPSLCGLGDPLSNSGWGRLSIRKIYT
jgi:hypothetical protein